MSLRSIEECEHELAKLRLQLDNLQIENFRLKLRLKSSPSETSALGRWTGISQSMENFGADNISATFSPPAKTTLCHRLHLETVKTLTRQLQDERKLRHAAEEERDCVLKTLRKLETLELQMVKDEMDLLRKSVKN